MVVCAENMDTPLASLDINNSSLDLFISKERGLIWDNSWKWHHYSKDKLFYPKFMVEQACILHMINSF
jgi:hypothetical protein